MTSDDATWLEEQLPLLLAACDEALAAGDAASASFTAAVPGELRPRLERDVAWCQLVRQLWATDGSTPPTLTKEAAPPVMAPPTQVGRFLIYQELGRGSFGVVYRAFDPVLSREVALKVPHPHVLASPELRARFQHEAQAAAGLDHPNLVSVYDSGQDDSLCFIASAYCPGPTLAAWLREHKEGMPHRRAAELVATLAEAVEHAHRRGVLHRDLKPANILLQEDLSPRRKDAKQDQEEKGQGDQSSSSLPSSLASLRLCERSSYVPKITDFGLAKLLECDTPGRSQSGAIVGTPSYMAPEQADGVKRTLGPTADVHALGAILYELLTGRPPFQGETVLETLLLVRSADPVPPRRLRPGLPPDLDTICLKCLHKEPGKRYGSAQALAEDLQRFLNGQPIQARATPLWERAWKWAQQRLAEAQRDLAVLVAKQGSAEEARRLVEQALGHARTARTLAPGVEGPRQEVAAVAAVRADILLTCGDHGEAARAAVELPSLFRDAGVGFRSAGALLARCAALASEDGNLPPGERQGQAEGYAGQAVSLLREALQRGAVVRNALRTDSVFAVLREREDFKELLREPPAK